MVNMRFPQQNQSAAHDFLEKKRLPLAIIKEIARLSAYLDGESGEVLPVNEVDSLILLEIAAKAGRMQVELCELLHLKKPTVSVSIKRLESTGLISRETDVLDHRASRLYLTEKGMALASVLEKRERDGENAAIKDLTTNERDMLVKLLAKVYENILK